MKNTVILIGFISLMILINMNLSAQQKEGRIQGFDKRWKTDTLNRVVEMNEFMSLLSRNYFIVLNYPEFLNKEKGLEAYFKYEPVIAVAINGMAKAYPLNILTFHEIANDTLGGIPILATYCPLCNAGVVFDRRFQVDDKETILDFGVSGMLRKSDMVIWDKQTETWWQQLTGEGLVGKLAGKDLKFYPSLIISVEEFFNTYPYGRILSKNTGVEKFETRYGTTAYVGYDSIGKEVSNERLFKEETSNRLPPMERIVDFYSEGEYKIYPFSTISKEGIVNDSFNGEKVVIFYEEKTVSVLDAERISESKNVGSVTMFSPYVDGKELTFNKKKKGIIDKESRSIWSITGKCLSGKYEGKQLMITPHGNHFAFAWLAFHPDSVIYGE